MQSQVTVYTAEQVSSLLGIPNTCTVPMPDTSSLKPGEILLWYPGCSLTQLRKSPLGKELMWQPQNWYDEKNFSTLLPGYYAVQVRVPESTSKTWKEQESLLAQAGESFQSAPAAIGATALLLHLKETGKDLLQNGGCRCKEVVAQGSRVVLTVGWGRVRVGYDWDDSRYNCLWLAAASKF